MAKKQEVIDKQFDLLFVSDEKKNHRTEMVKAFLIKPRLSQWDLKLLEERAFAKLFKKLFSDSVLSIDAFTLSTDS